MKRAKMFLDHARGDAKPIIEFVPAQRVRGMPPRSPEVSPSDYFWIGDRDGEAFAFCDVADLFAFVDRVRSQYEEPVPGEVYS